MPTFLVPIDFSPVSSRIVTTAANLARALGGRLVLLHVVPPPVLTDTDFGTQLTTEYTAQAEAAADRRLAALCRRLERTRVAASVRRTAGYPGPAILAVAEELRPDFIVLGSHGHGAFYELVVGGTASRVLKRARCPVIVVPPVPERPRRRRG